MVGKVLRSELDWGRGRGRPKWRWINGLRDFGWKEFEFRRG